MSALTVMGAPCMSEPETMMISFPTSRLNLANMSAGRRDPVTWPT